MSPSPPRRKTGGPAPRIFVDFLHRRHYYVHSIARLPDSAITLINAFNRKCSCWYDIWEFVIPSVLGDGRL